MEAESPREKFKKEQLALFHRWSLESDLTLEEFIYCTEESLTQLMGDVMICFTPDDSVTDWLFSMPDEDEPE